MKLYAFGLLLCATVSADGGPEHGLNGSQCFIGGYQYFPKLGAYKLYSVNTNWHDAWKQCKDDGAYLAVINSRLEYEVVREMQKAVNQPQIYIGVHDFFKEGHFSTVTGEDFVPSESLKWGTGEPNNHGGNENCVTLRSDGLLNDVGCSSQHYFICEHKHDPSSPLIPKPKNP